MVVVLHCWSHSRGRVAMQPAAAPVGYGCVALHKLRELGQHAPEAGTSKVSASLNGAKPHCATSLLTAVPRTVCLGRTPAHHQATCSVVVGYSPVATFWPRANAWELVPILAVKTICCFVRRTLRAVERCGESAKHCV